MAAEVLALIRPYSVTLVLALTQCVEDNPNLVGTLGDPTTDAGGSSSGPASSGGSVSTVDSSTTSDPTTETGEDPSAGDHDCPASTHACTAAAPRGWSGPVAVIHDTNGRAVPSCDAPFDAAPAVLAYGELEAETAECSCVCEPVDPGCAWVHMLTDDVPACSSLEGGGSVALAADCQSVSPNTTGFVASETSELTAGACFPAASSHTPDVHFGSRSSLCGAELLDAPETCEAEEVCAAVPSSPFDGALCIWSPGDVPCPTALGYDQRELLHQDVEDTRGCTECTCGEIAGTCSTTLELWTGDDCDGSLLAEIDSGSACEEVDGVAGSGRVVDINPDVTCGSPSGAQPAGQATPTDPITLCCR